MPVSVTRFAGSTAGERLQVALAALSDDGGVVDCRGLSESLVLDVDVFEGFDRRPVELLFGPASFLVTSAQTLPPNCVLSCEGTRFVGGTALQYMFAGRMVETVGLVSSTTTADIAIAGNEVRVGDVVGVMGTVTTGSQDRTLLTDPVGQDLLQIPADTEGFPDAGVIRIGDELIRYGSKAEDEFLVETHGRGYGGTTKQSHGLGSEIVRVVFGQFLVVDLAGSVATLDRAVGVTGSALPVQIGASGVAIEGNAVLDGADVTSSEAFAIGASVAGGWHVGSDTVVRDWAGSGVRLRFCRDSTVDGIYESIATSGTGSAVDIAQSCRRVHVSGTYRNCPNPVSLRDRLSENPDWDNRRYDPGTWVTL